MPHAPSSQPPQVVPPSPFGPTPSVRQLAWHELEFYGFIHFTVNTFTDREWGYGDETPSVFTPTDFDAHQIVETAAAGGMKGLILTCKHHDGFCLWPSRYTEHSVRNAPWRQGNGDVVREISDACATHGLRFGVYLSPWDRHHPEYGRPAYTTYYRNQLRELLTEYGPLFEVWFDGANGGDGYYGGAREHRSIDARTYYEWERTWDLVRELQPDACIFSDAGPDIRWVGNESGVAGDPCWHTLRPDDLAPGAADPGILNSGHRFGSHWIPAECDVSIRPGWFYHSAEDDQVRSAENLLDLYFQSVGRGTNLLLNLPPDRRGRIHDNDVQCLRAFRKRLDAIQRVDLTHNAQASASQVRGNDPAYGPANLLDDVPEHYWATDDDIRDAEVTLMFPEAVTFNTIDLREYLPLGQRIERYAIYIDQHGHWQPIATGTGIGRRRLIRTAQCTTERLRLRVVDGPVGPALSKWGLYLDTEAP